MVILIHYTFTKSVFDERESRTSTAILIVLLIINIFFCMSCSDLAIWIGVVLCFFLVVVFGCGIFFFFLMLWKMFHLQGLFPI